MSVAEPLVLHLARQLELRFPDLPTVAIWRLGDGYVLVADPTDSVHTFDEIQQWMRGDEATLAPASFATEPPPGAVSVNRDVGSNPFVNPAARNRAGIWYELRLELPDLPLQGVMVSDDQLVVRVSAPLDHDQRRRIESTLRQLGFASAARIDVVQEGNKPPAPAGSPTDRLTLAHSSTLTDPVLRRFAEQDEEAWRSSRLSARPTKVDRGSRCLVLGTVFDTLDIRNHLTLFETVLLAPPIAGREERVLGALGVSRAELVRLVATGRVRILLLQSVHRYDPTLLRELLEAESAGVIGPRQAAATCVAEFRHRNPLVLDADEANVRVVLAGLQEVALGTTEPVVATYARVLAEWLANARMWFGPRVSWEGVLALGGIGAGRVVGDLHHAISGQDARLECTAASAPVHLAAAFNAALFPELGVEEGAPRRVRYSSEQALELVSAVYTGPRGQTIDRYPTHLDEVVAGLLRIDGGVPVLEWASAITVPEIARLRALVTRLIREHVSAEEVRDVVRGYNAQIQRYRVHQQRRDTMLDVLDLLGFATSVAEIATGQGVPGVIMWAAQAVLKVGKFQGSRAARGIRARSHAFDAALDAVEAATSLTPRDVVLVARVRERARALVENV